jgi:hypothetical protein
VRAVWDLYASTLVAIWQRLVSLNISWDFDVPGKVIMTRGIFTVVVPSAGDRLLIHISLALVTATLKFANPSEMSSAGAVTGRGRITAFISFWDFG